ncbi:pilus assembly protein, partial [Salmonella enterica]|nr:pilus assembly protein [Salmonella enterica]
MRFYFNLVLKRCFFNEKHKKLIIASVLSMITASCYAGSIVVGSEQQSSVDIGFASPQQLS